MTLLAADLKESTKSVHTMAERSKFVRHFFRGEITSDVYIKYLISLYYVYRALEMSLERHRDNSNVDLVYFPEQLSRMKAIEEDLEFYNGSEWRSTLTAITPAQKSYIDALERCDTTKPELLIAHCYVRYLGDLSGGQILSKKLQKHNNLPEGKGVAFYTFGNIEDKESFKELYRKRLNQVAVDSETYIEIIEESQQAFVKVIDIFQELDALLDDSSDSTTENSPLLCPFMVKSGRKNQIGMIQIKPTEGTSQGPTSSLSAISPRSIKSIVANFWLRLTLL
ncbi:heme oxygenase (decycling) 1 [Entomortierella beljakovae]|nr:heme oxygenase (decycling) 1 [Entomortierella beljakovae]